MLLGKRFILALIIALGWVNCAMAAPIALNLTQADVLIDSARNTFVDASALAAAGEINLEAINLSYGIHQQANNFNFLKTDTIKTEATPIQVPEPNAIILLGLGLLGLTLLRRRKR